MTTSCTSRTHQIPVFLTELEVSSNSLNLKITRSYNHQVLNEKEVVGRQGFEPWKPAGDRFTVCSLCPLGYLPARVSRELQISAGRSLATRRHVRQENDLRASSSLAENKERPTRFPSGNRGWWIDPHSQFFCQETTNSIEKPHPCQERPAKRQPPPPRYLGQSPSLGPFMTQA